jgi:hypothetical protein
MNTDGHRYPRITRMGAHWGQTTRTGKAAGRLRENSIGEFA